MQMTLIAIGKTQSSWLQDGNAEYGKRLKHYGRFQFIETVGYQAPFWTPDPQWVMQEEAKLLDKHLKGVDHLVLLDENGKSYSSIAFSKHIEKLQVRGLRHIAWVIGGPYGFAPRIRDLAQEQWS